MEVNNGIKSDNTEKKNCSVNLNIRKYLLRNKVTL